jgi:hypothetical protein
MLTSGPTGQLRNGVGGYKSAKLGCLMTCSVLMNTSAFSFILLLFTSF